MKTAAPRIVVLAGTNGAGKSSVFGEVLLESGAAFYNPDLAARQLRDTNPKLSIPAANGLAWRQGVALLRRAIATRADFNFESTLGGGNTIPGLLKEAAGQGFEVTIFFAGLHTAELHIERVAARVRRGGHDIPEQDIRRRFVNSRLTLIGLMPHLHRLKIYDNSRDALDSTQAVSPQLLLDFRDGRIRAPEDFSATPEWAKPLIKVAIDLNIP